MKKKELRFGREDAAVEMGCDPEVLLLTTEFEGGPFWLNQKTGELLPAIDERRIR